MVYECWKEIDDSGEEVSFFPEDNASARKMLGEGAELLYKFEAASWQDALAEHKKRQGWDNDNRHTKLDDRRETRHRKRKLFEKDVSEWSFEEIRRILSERYEETHVPPCAVCGGELGVQAVGGGKPTEYAHQTYVGGKLDWDHYERSRWTDSKSGGDEVVMELLRRFAAICPTGPATAEQLEQMKVLVDDVEMSIRTANMCKNAGIKTIGQLASLTHSEFIKLKNRGNKKSLEELGEILAAKGLRFGMQERGIRT